jgi:hypothetical protein
VVSLPGGGSQSYSITQVPAQTGNQALNALVTAQGAQILADLGITSGSITVVGDDIVITGDADGSPIPGSILFTLIVDSGDSPIDTASVTLTAGEPVTQNNAPTFTNALPASADDNTQSLTVTNVDAGEVKGNDTFIANSPDVDPNNLIDSGDKLAFDGATVAGVTAGPVNHLFDGPGVFGDVGSYANAFALANSIMASNAVLDYVSMRVGGDTFVFADLDGGNAVDQAVQLVGVTTIANTQIIADPNPVV